MNKVKMINALGNEMWVAEDRIKEYEAAGHKLAADASNEGTTENAEGTEEEPAEEPEMTEPEEAEEVPEEPAEEPENKGKRSGKTKTK